MQGVSSSTRRNTHETLVDWKDIGRPNPVMDRGAKAATGLAWVQETGIEPRTNANAT